MALAGVFFVMFFTASIITDNLHAFNDVGVGCSQKDGTYHMDTGYEEDFGCNLSVWNHSSTFFRSMLRWKDPRFARFKIIIVNQNLTLVHVDQVEDAFRPFNWVWTYEAASGCYPFLSWNIDYGLLSFGLLDAETLNMEPYVRLIVDGNCNLTLGTINTTRAIAKALTQMTSEFNNDTSDSPKYDNSYYCFLARNPTIRDTFAYYAAMYMLFPISYLNYNCCKTCHDYMNNKFDFICNEQQIEKWSQCLIGPYVLGIIIFLFFPIYLLKFMEYLSRNEKIVTRDHPILSYDEPSHADWVSLNGNSPYPFSHLFNSLWFGFDKRHPIIASKIRRVLLLCVAPLVIYAQLLLYSQQKDAKIFKEVLNFGTPTGFLSILGNKEDRRYFAPFVGGSVSLLSAFYVIGFLFLVLPWSFKQVVENGIPRYTKPVSPLFLGIEDVWKLSMLPVNPNPGYGNGASLCRCGMYLIFSKSFWSKVLEIQKTRVSSIFTFRGNILKVSGTVLLTPIYVAMCILECFICVLYYGIPICVFVSVIVSGACKSILNFAILHSFYSRHSVLRIVLFKPLIFLGILFVFAMFLLFAYAACLIFIQSFYFVSEIAVFTFVSVIVFPNVAFGYLFFFLVLIYYLARLIRDFGDGYLMLLSDVVDILKSLPDIDPEFQPPKNQPASQQKLKLNNDCYFIPRALFEFVVERHLPVHLQLLRVILHIGFILTLIAVTLSIITKYVSGPTSDISNVMHILFIVIVGAIPRILEFAFISASHAVKRKIELRQLKRSVEEFWNRNFDNTSIENDVKSGPLRIRVLNTHNELPENEEQILQYRSMPETNMLMYNEARANETDRHHSVVSLNEGELERHDNLQFKGRLQRHGPRPRKITKKILNLKESDSTTETEIKVQVQADIHEYEFQTSAELQFECSGLIEPPTLEADDPFRYVASHDQRDVSFVHKDM